MFVTSIVNIVLLLSAFAQAAPSMRWIPCPDSDSADRCLEVRFENEDVDIAELDQAYENDNTNFVGYFMNAPDVRVFASTPDRQLGFAKIHVSFADPRSPKQTMFEVNTKRGTAVTSTRNLDRSDQKRRDIILHPDSGYNYNPTVKNGNSPAGKTFDLKLAVVYDNAFKARFGPSDSAAIAKVNTLLGHAQTMFLWSSLEAKMTLVTEVKHFDDDIQLGSESDDYGFDQVSDYLDDLDDLATDNSSPDLFVFMTDAEVPTNDLGILGVAYGIGTVCSKKTIKKTNINGYFDNGDGDIYTAETIAHEIGHNLNMYHDFDQNDGGARFCDTDASINCQGFCNMMDYPQCTVDAWSCCSNSDFANMYNALGNDFCLSESGVTGGNCKDKKSTKKCKRLKKKGKCSKKKIAKKCKKTCNKC